MTCGIYLISNEKQKLYYIGQSSNIETRWVQHRHVLRGRSKLRANKMLRHAWGKYGEESFSFSILEECSVDLLTEREAHWIETYRSFQGAKIANAEGPCDNPMRGNRHRPESIQKMSEFQRGRSKSEIHRERIGAAHLGRVYSDEVRARMSASKKGRVNRYWKENGNPAQTDEHRERMRTNNPAKTPEFKAALAERTRKPVIAVETMARWGSLADCAKDLGVSAAAVSLAIKTSGRRCKGILLALDI